MLRVRFELTTSACLILLYKYDALTDCAPGAAVGWLLITVDRTHAKKSPLMDMCDFFYTVTLYRQFQFMNIIKKSTIEDK